MLISGALWGLMPSLSKLSNGPIDGLPAAISLSITVNFLGAWALFAMRLYRGRLRWPTLRQWGFYVTWAFCYSALNQVLVYWVSQNLPASLLSVITVLEGFIVYSVAQVSGLDRANFRRFMGLMGGGIGVTLLLIDTLGGNDVPDWHWLAIAFVIPITFAAESLLIAAFKPRDAGALAATSYVMLLSIPMLVAIGLGLAPAQELMPDADQFAAAVPIALATATANCCYYAMITSCGAIFAGQTSNVITLCGVGWGVLLLNENLSGGFVLSLMVILASLALTGIGRVENAPAK